LRHATKALRGRARRQVRAACAANFRSTGECPDFDLIRRRHDQSIGSPISSRRSAAS
jgi:hypothetical protein